MAVPLNVPLMRNPANWAIIGLMMLFAILAFHYIADLLSNKKEV